MSLRWHVPLPGPFTVSGNVVPKMPKQVGGVFGSGVIAILIVGAGMAVIYYAFVFWWITVPLLTGLWFLGRHLGKRNALPTAEQWQEHIDEFDATHPETAKLFRQSAESSDEPHGAGPHIRGEKR